jgi:3-hydroxyacyl-CoA dehydrogenase
LAIDSFALQGIALPHDVVVANHLANVLSGGATDMLDITEEDNILALEKKAFMTLVKSAPTLARMETILATGKPLRN